MKVQWLWKNMVILQDKSTMNFKSLVENTSWKPGRLPYRKCLGLYETVLQKEYKPEFQPPLHKLLPPL